MLYSIENECLKITVDAQGAQLISVVRKEDGVEHMWRRDPEVWGSCAPILFPYAGRLKDGKFTAKGKTYEGRLHGFARNLPHTLVAQSENSLTFQLTDSEETLERWPYRFCLESTFLLDGDTLHHTLRVENHDDEAISFGIGYHPGFAVPFDDSHTFADYELRFDKAESPLCVDTSNEGLVGDKLYYLGKNITAIPVDEHLFDNDSHLMVGLQSKTLGLYEKDTGRGVVCGIHGFPYVLIWSEPGAPQFVCIEPWHSTPSPVEGGYAWEEKPAAAILQPGEDWSTTMSTAFIR